MTSTTKWRIATLIISIITLVAGFWGGKIYIQNYNKIKILNGELNATKISLEEKNATLTNCQENQITAGVSVNMQGSGGNGNVTGMTVTPNCKDGGPCTGLKVNMQVQ